MKVCSCSILNILLLLEIRMPLFRENKGWSKYKTSSIFREEMNYTIGCDLTEEEHEKEYFQVFLVLTAFRKLLLEFQLPLRSSNPMALPWAKARIQAILLETSMFICWRSTHQV